MKFPQNILVVVSGKQHTHIALNRVMQLARFYDIQINLLSCVYDPGTELSPLLSDEVKNKLKSEKIQERQKYLEQIQRKIQEKGITSTATVKWHRKIQTAVIQTCEEIKPDLVVKRISENASRLNPFNMPADWQLLRHCPVPLLIIKDENWNLSAPVLAAVDATKESPEDITFNQQIIDYSKLVSRLTDTPVHLVTTHITPTIDNAISIPGFDLQQLRKEVTKLNHDKLSDLIKNKNIDKKNLHIIEGLAEEKIPQLANEINAQLVVMGTICRSGLKGALMGNTAEKVLTHLQCEVLALKP
ncbi:universal stress protein UspE [Aliikangiella maris]|uniref:Universal stress protein UspE n=2 Tax=Aliikangiella maris TaxID=3162458 RepID=A0ABV3MIN8_9GAMM